MLKFPRKSALGVIAIGAIAIAAACGGGDDGDESASVDEYISMADQICARFDPQFEALEEPTTADDVRPFLVETLELGQQQTAELEALDVPDELAELEAEARANNQNAVDALEGAIERIDNGEAIGPIVDDIAAQSQQIEDEGSRIAEEMGLEVCGADDEADTTTTEDPPDDTLGDPEPADTVENAAAQYLVDVNAATTSLNEIGAVFTNATDRESLQAQAGAVQEGVDEFSAAIDSMSSYSLDDGQLEEQRVAFVEAGRNLAGPLSDLSDAVAAGDIAELQAVIPPLQEAAAEFDSAANQTP